MRGSQGSAPPPPPRKKNHSPTNNSIPGNVVGAGYNVPRALKSANQSTAAESEHERNICLVDDEPDTVIGHGIEISGELQFERLLRIDGKFQGKLISPGEGDLIIGKHGCLMGDVVAIKRMIIEGGYIHGNICVDELFLFGNSIVKGDITCKLIQVDGLSTTIIGNLNIHPLSPEVVDENDNIISVPSKVYPYILWLLFLSISWYLKLYNISLNFLFSTIL